MKTKTPESLAGDIRQYRDSARWSLGLTAVVGVLEAIPLQESSPQAADIATAMFTVGGLMLARSFRKKQLAAEHQLHGYAQPEQPARTVPKAAALPVPVD